MSSSETLMKKTLTSLAVVLATTTANAQTTEGALKECTRWIQQYKPNFDVFLDVNSMLHYRPNTSYDEIYAFDKCMNTYGIPIGPLVR